MRKAVLLVSALALAGCEVGSNRRSLGIDPPPPDEFLVIAGKPLEMPADFETLPTPRLGAADPNAPQPQRAAAAALYGDAAADAALAPSAGESALIAGAGAAEPGIRETLAAEKPEPQRRYGLSSILGTRIEQDPEAAGQRITAEAEAERLRGQGVAVPNAPPKPAAPGQ